MKSATDRVHATLGRGLNGLTLESIAAVKDFTARKTLEQAYALARGLAAVLRDAPQEQDQEKRQGLSSKSSRARGSASPTPSRSSPRGSPSSP